MHFSLDKILTRHPEIKVVHIQAKCYDHNTKGTVNVSGSYETYEVCRKHNKPIIIMEPVKDGSFAKVDEHDDVKKVFNDADNTETPVSWAFRYDAFLDVVLMVLSDMSTIKQMKQNVEILGESFKPLTDSEKDMLAKAAKLIESKISVGCTGCH